MEWLYQARIEWILSPDRFSSDSGAMGKPREIGRDPLQLFFSCYCCWPLSLRPAALRNQREDKGDVVYVCACLRNKVLRLHDRSQDRRALRLRNAGRPATEGSARDDSAWARREPRGAGEVA